MPELIFGCKNVSTGSFLADFPQLLVSLAKIGKKYFKNCGFPVKFKCVKSFQDQCAL